MKIKNGTAWFEPRVDAPVMVVLTPKEKQDIASMASDATMYAVFSDDCGMSSNERLAWMTQPDPALSPEGRYSLLVGHPIPMHQADTPGVDEPPRRRKPPHSDVLAAHAQFGGDLEDMDRKYRPPPAAEGEAQPVAQLEAELSRLKGVERERDELRKALHDLQTRFDLELDAYAKDSDIAHLRAERDELRGALKPFAEAGFDKLAPVEAIHTARALIARTRRLLRQSGERLLRP